MERLPSFPKRSLPNPSHQISRFVTPRTERRSMASSVSAWAKPGAWALDAEQQEASMAKEDDADASLLLQQQQPQQEFPSLAAAASSKTSKKKKKAQPISFAEFATGKPVTRGTGGRPASSSSKGLTPDELILLPTGPRERSAEELERSSSRGFGYSSYGSGGARSRTVSGEDPNPTRWGSSRGSDETGRGGFGGSGGGSDRDLGPSRADEIDDWGAAKKSVVPERRERGGPGGFFDSQSRADDSDSWISSKSVAPPVEARRIGSRGGFDAPRERRGGFDMLNKEGSVGAGADSETWGRKKDFVMDPGTWNRETERSSGERRRLVLQPRSSPLPDGNTEQQVQGEQDKRPMEKRGKGSNPFGEARPREEVLAEKGQDWKKIEEQLETMKIRDVPSESSSIGRKGFGATNETQQSPESRSDRAWRKPDAADSSPARENKADNSDN